MFRMSTATIPRTHHSIYCPYDVHYALNPSLTRSPALTLEAWATANEMEDRAARHQAIISYLQCAGPIYMYTCTCYEGIQSSEDYLVEYVCVLVLVQSSITCAVDKKPIGDFLESWNSALLIYPFFGSLRLSARPPISSSYSVLHLHDIRSLRADSNRVDCC